MLRSWKKIIKKIFYKPFPEQLLNNLEEQIVSNRLDINTAYLKAVFSRCTDVVIREFEVGINPPIKAAIVYVDGLVNKEMITDDLIKTLMYEASRLNNAQPIQNQVDYYSKKMIAFTEVKPTGKMSEFIDLILSGETGFLVDGLDKCFTISAQDWIQRGIQQPDTETVVRGPKEGFTESIQVNISLLRRRIKSPKLKFENIKVGTYSKTDVAICYIEGIVNDKIVSEVKKRIKKIEIDGVLESGYIEEFIEDAPLSVFPTVNSTERPDRVAGGLLEGQVAILTDTTPFVLMVPVTFPQLLQSTEDYYLRWPYASFVRLIRFLTLNIALLLPSFYIAIVTYHQEMIPTPLLISIAAAREGVPFPAFIEALLMETTFEILREAGLRLPKAIGQAISIVGALVIGEAAVTAGLVSPGMVIIVALTAIASFTIPSYTGGFALRILRFPLMALAAFLGLFGIMAGLLALLIYLCSLRSFGIPYVSPLSPTSWRDLKDMFFRMPWWGMDTRPRLQGYKDPTRQNPGQKPQPPRQRDKGRKSRK